MASAYNERAISDALASGNALLKFISPNDTGMTGSHQCGFYLPRSVWEMYTPHPPTKGSLEKHNVKVLWPDGRVTSSVVTWYGKGTRSEYRLTHFGRDFPWLTHDNVGNLLVLIPKGASEFSAYVLDREEDIEELQAALGVVPFDHWGVFRHGVAEIVTEDECIDREIRRFTEPLEEFPTGDQFSDSARRFLEKCIEGGLDTLDADSALLRAVSTEYRLFRMAERLLCQNDIARVFRDIDNFLTTAATIMNRRKSRAGRSLENHTDYLLNRAEIPHEMRPDIDGRPDIVIPSRKAYFDADFPQDRLYIVGVKTTCKDRWRQVLNEGKKAKRKYILTTQPGISSNQLDEMAKAKVTLVVPEGLHDDYPPNHPIGILTMESFFSRLRRSLVN
jgi:type II restriction enzyme